ncbi:MAG: uL15m family ribosomal protein [Nanoarchaeota archaeon]|nr:uL15m family ribosomal protein [Nanoarchaeota archaeon]
MPFKKRRKSARRHGYQTAFRGAKERTRGSGNRGGKGMAGTGKRGDAKKTLILNLPEPYFGKSRTLRRGHVPKKLQVINLDDISKNHADSKEVKLKGYKILGEGTLSFKTTIHASAASFSAAEKIKKAGSELIIIQAEEKASAPLKPVKKAPVKKA